MTNEDLAAQDVARHSSPSLSPSPSAPKGPNIVTDASYVDIELKDNGGKAQPADADELGPYPTEDELKTLRRIPDKIPFRIYAITAVEFCERFSYYGVMIVVTNFVQWHMPAGSTTGASPHGQPGAMGFGQRVATTITTFNVFWQYFMPLFGAYIADTYLGRFRTVALALGIDIFGHLILLLAGLPPLLKQTPARGSMACLIMGMLIIGVGTGGFKPNVNPLIVEQAASKHMYVRVLSKTGERVIVDPAVTSSRIFHYFYMFINIGALFGQVGMVYAEKYVGFWLSFLLPTCMLCICPLIVWWGRKRYVRVPPQGSVLSKAIKLFFLAAEDHWSFNPVGTYRSMNDGYFWERVKPSQRSPERRPSWMTFDDAWVDEVARGFKACKVFMWMPFFWLCYNQMTGNLVSQAALLKLGSIPNDALISIEPVCLVILILLLNEAIYPLMRRFRFNFTPIKKIAVGYAIASVTMAYAAVLQQFIYKKSECGTYASGNLPNGERCPNVEISVWAQVGCYALLALAEILVSTTCLEYAQSKAPKNMRSMVQAVSLSMNAISTALGFAFVALSSDPHLVWNYGVVAVLAAVAGTGFWFTFRNLDKEEDRLNMLPNGALKADSPAEEQKQGEAKVNAAA
ncbi:hypothetical protein Sste5346_001397 [Sporothrix stenoceras]|uniref:Uncharacterized protein n=1 Tax=Sporothrix stenoceras TaxID=5173 RepID=A0ABR3ZQJ1_9PEZI